MEIKLVEFGNTRIKLEKNTYTSNGNLAIQLMCYETEYTSWLPYTSLTVNFDEPLPKDFAYIDTNNFPIAEEFIKQNKLGEYQGKQKKSGFCTYPLYKFNMAEVDKYLLEIVEHDTAYEVVETCPHCEKEITLNWNVAKDGYEIYCPNCGERIMLCSECLESDFCDWKNGKCHKQTGKKDNLNAFQILKNETAEIKATMLDTLGKLVKLQDELAKHTELELAKEHDKKNSCRPKT